VLVTTLTGHAYAFSLARGDLEWDWPAPPAGALWASPVAYGEEVIVGVASPYGDIPLVAGRMVGLDLATGRERWSVCVRAGCEPGGGVWSTAAIDSHGIAFVGVGNPIDGVLAFDASTGNRRWLSSLYPDQNRDLDVGASPVIFSLNGAEAVAQVTVEGMAAVVDAASGTIVWSRELVTGSAVHGLIASPAYDGTNIDAGSASPPTAMFALNPSDGSTAWRFDAAEPIYSAPAAGKGVIIFGTGAVFGDLNAGSVVALSSAGGHRLWSFDAHSAVRSGPALAGDYVVAGDFAGDLLVFRPSA
jgi:polyvinyl alcohol dehydrogenase (cytochrome)